MMSRTRGLKNLVMRRTWFAGREARIDCGLGIRECGLELAELALEDIEALN